MKRFLLLVLATVIVLSLSACKGGNGDVKDDTSDNLSASESSASTTAATASVIDEEGVKLMLFAYDSEITGLSAEPDEYLFKITSATFNGKPANKAEATVLVTGELHGVFYIVGEACYRYDSAQNKYYELTDKKAEEIKDEVIVAEITEATTASPATTEKAADVKTEQDIADENKNVLVSRYENYDLSVVGLPKPISEYEFQTTTKTAVATDGETVFIIYVTENGAYTEFTFAVGPEKDYYLDNSTGEYKPLS